MLAAGVGGRGCSAVGGLLFGLPGSAGELHQQGDQGGTDEHRQPEVGKDRTAQGDDRDPGEAFQIGGGFMAW